MNDSGKVLQNLHVLFPRVFLATTRDVGVQLLVDSSLIDIDGNAWHIPVSLGQFDLATKITTGKTCHP